MNQGTRRESENVAHRFFIRNAYLFQKGQQNILPAVLPASNFRIRECVTLEPRWN